MREGKTLTGLAEAIENEQKRKHDLIADTRQMTYARPMVVGSETDGVLDMVRGPANLVVVDHGEFRLTAHAERQLATRLKVPGKFYNLMFDGTDREQEALSEVMNARLQEHGERRMVRTLMDTPGQPGNGVARAVLSDRYKRLDNFDLVMKALPVLQEQPELKIISCELTERRMYIKAVFPRLQADVQKGDPVQGGVVISNSEVGEGSLRVEPLILRLICLNGMTAPVRMHRRHVGRQQGEGILTAHSDETRAATDAAVWMQVADELRAMTNAESFKLLVAELTASTTRTIAAPPAAVEVLGKTFNLTEVECTGILTAMVNGDEVLASTGTNATQYGLIQAVTAFSQKVENYDRASELEAIGGKLLNLPARDWQRIATAAA